MLDALDPADKGLWATAFYAGLRRGELIGLQPEDVDLANGVIHVRRGWDMLEGEIEPKSRKGRRKVPIPAVLRDHLYALERSAGPIFGTAHWVAKSTCALASAGRRSVCPCSRCTRPATRTHR